MSHFRHPSIPISWAGLLVLALWLLPCGQRATAGYLFTRISLTVNVFNNSGAPIPAINNNGVVAFRASLVSFNVGQGIYTGDGGPLTTVAFNGTGGNVGSFGFTNHLAINDSGVVAFTALGAPGAGFFSAAYVGSGGPLTTILTNPGPFGSQDISFPAINDAGTVAVVASNSGFTGTQGVEVLTGDGTSLTTVIATTSFFQMSDPAINDLGQVLFNWFGLNGFARGIYLADGAAILPIFETNDPNEFILTPVDVNNNGEVAYYVRRTIGTYRLVIGDGVNDRTVLSGNFTGNLPSVAFNDNGTLALLLDGAILVGTDVTNFTPVIGVGDPLDGSTVTGLAFGRYGLNDQDEVAFYATLADGRRGVYAATLPSPSSVPEPSSVVLCLLGGCAFLAHRAISGSRRRAGRAGERSSTV